MRPGLGLRGVGEQVHDDGSLVDGLVNVEEVLARDPAVLLGLLPRGTALSDTDDDVQAVVAKVESLTVSLRAVSDESECVVLEVLEELLSWPVGSLCARVRSPQPGMIVQSRPTVDILLDTGKVNSLDTTSLLRGNGDLWGLLDSRSAASVQSSSQVSPLLNS